jgi:hypothetical protein
MKVPRKLKKKVKKTLESQHKGKVKVSLIDKSDGITRWVYKLTNKKEIR